MERYLKAIQQNVLYEVIISKEDKSKKEKWLTKILELISHIWHNAKYIH